MHEGVLVESTSAVTDTNYAVTNAADETRAVVVEHTRQPRAELIPENPTDADKTANMDKPPRPQPRPIASAWPLSRTRPSICKCRSTPTSLKGCKSERNKTT